MASAAEAQRILDQLDKATIKLNEALIVVESHPEQVVRKEPETVSSVVKDAKSLASLIFISHNTANKKRILDAIRLKSKVMYVLIIGFLRSF